MNYTAKGKIKLIEETQKISDSFKKRVFVVTDNSNADYPQHISFQMTQDNCSKLDSVKVGDEVEVSFGINGREWTNPKDGLVSYFNSLQSWKVEKQGQAETVAPETNDLPWD